MKYLVTFIFDPSEEPTMANGYWPSIDGFPDKQE